MHIVLLKCQIALFEIHHLWQSGFSRMYSNCCYSCSFEPEIIKIGQSSRQMYSNNMVNFQESTTILNACTKRVRKLIEGTTYIYFTPSYVNNTQPFSNITTQTFHVYDITVIKYSLNPICLNNIIHDSNEFTSIPQ